MKSQNLDKLSQEAKDMIALMFKEMITGWTNTYMIEVRLDDPINHMLFGGDGLETHGGNGSKCYAKHWDDPNWAVIHCQDEDWIENPGNELMAIKYLEDLETK
jgi:hypothetical protein